MNSNQILNKRINEAAKILIHYGWSYLDCITVLKSTTPEWSVKSGDNQYCTNIPPIVSTPTDGGNEFNPVRTLRTDIMTTTPEGSVKSGDSPRYEPYIVAEKGKGSTC